MKNKEKTKEQLITELEKLQLQIDELRPSTIKPEQNGSLFHIKDSYLRLMHVITAVTSDETIEIKDAFESILNEICHYTGWPIGHVYALAKDDPDLLVPTEYWHLENNINKFTEFCNVTAVTKFARGIGLPGRVLSSGKPCFIRDVRKDRGFLRAGIAKDLGIKSGFAFPVYVGTKIVAVQEHFTTEEVSFDNQFMEILVDLGTQIGRIFERKQIRNGVNEVEERYQAVFEQATDSLAIVDGNTGEIVEFNKHAHENLGYTREEFKKLKVSDIDVIESPDDIAKHIQKIMREGIDTFETRHKTKDGKIRDMQIIAKVMSIPGKNLISSVWRDITERRQAEEGLKELNQSLEKRVAKRTEELVKINEELAKVQKLESLGILAGGIAHDFNNSLQGILSTITLAKTYASPEDEIYKKLEESEKAVLQSRDLPKQLLTFSKGGDPVRQTVSLSKLLKNSTILALSGSNVKCELGMPIDLWPVEVDSGQINQVMNNIIINSIQSMPEGGKIKIWAENVNVSVKDSLPLQEGRYVKITIKDQGTGIPHEHLEKIFDPYFTSKEKGSGLGLSISYSIIIKHDGHIAVDSETGTGTTFCIYLPASQKEVSVESEQRDAREVVTKEVPLTGKGKILIMDDEAIISLAIARNLKNLKYKVETARDGAEAIDLYTRAMKSREPFDAVIMDLTIPGGMGGKEAIKELLKIDHNVKAILASGYINGQTAADFRKYGFCDFIAKPYEISELIERLNKVLMIWDK